jgi:L-asparaginase
VPLVQIIHTGGTLGMAHADGVWAPRSGHLRALLEGLPELHHPDLPEWRLVEFDELLDSSNVGPVEWRSIAQAIQRRNAACSGFVIVHGTDTMAYTAAALSFMLQGLDKPVIVTGSQLPLEHPRTDARENLVTSMMLAATPGIREVCLYFNGRLLRGNRITKTDTSGFVAFDSPNCESLGSAGTSIVLHRDRLLGPDPRSGHLDVAPMGDAVVGAFRLFPGVNPRTLETLLAPPLQGLVLECFGTGNAPNRNPELLAVIERAVERGVVVVAVTQCLRGRVDMDLYETGVSLAAAGVTPGYDMTAEAALAKLIYLLDQGMEPAEVRAQMVESIRGELTPPGG